MGSKKDAVEYATKFSDDEKIIFLSIIEQYKEVIATSETDKISNKNKGIVWEIIHDEYIEAVRDKGFTTSRTKDQLQKLWSNLKHHCRQVGTQRKHYELMTGGGPPLSEDSDEINEMVERIVPEINLTVPNDFNSTSKLENSTNVKNVSINISSSDSDVPTPKKRLIVQEKRSSVDMKKKNAQKHRKRPTYNQNWKLF